MAARLISPVLVVHDFRAWAIRAWFFAYMTLIRDPFPRLFFLRSLTSRLLAFFFSTGIATFRFRIMLRCGTME